MQQAIVTFFNQIGKRISHYQYKDLDKFLGATKLIAFGSNGSSTDLYRRAIELMYPDRVNQLMYDQDDVVVVSVNGNRRGAIPPTFEGYMTCVGAAILAKATIVADNSKDRERHYNTGEKLLATMLANSGYADPDGRGVWVPVV